ncbi:Helix-turn-helix domain protein [compost metagenome]
MWYFQVMKNKTQISETSFLRQFYTPVQPTVRLSAASVSYTEFLPSVELQNRIYCYWQLKTNEPLNEQFNYRVVADGCIDIFVELNDPSDSYVMGFCKKFTEFPLENAFNYVGIRFFPSMFPQMFQVSAKELSNRFEQLDSVVPAVAAFIRDNLDASQSMAEIGNLFDQYFKKQANTGNFDEDNRFYGALQLILKNQGIIDVESDLQTGISSRQLRRLFEYYIGDTPKTFSQVVRFQNILKAKPSSQSLRKNKLFFDAGYYDQAHFIKEFKNFYGVTPGKAFGR